MKSIFSKVISVAILTVAFVTGISATETYTQSAVKIPMCQYYHNDETVPFYEEFAFNNQCNGAKIEPPTHLKMTDAELRVHAPDCVVTDEIVILEEDDR